MIVIALSNLVTLDLWADLEQRVRAVRQPVTDEELDRMTFDIVRKMENQDRAEIELEAKDLIPYHRPQHVVVRHQRQEIKAPGI